jgi:hypothetical protein
VCHTWHSKNTSALCAETRGGGLTSSHIMMYWHADRFCGRIIAWGPKFHEVKYMTDPKDFDTLMIKNSEYLISGQFSTGNNFDDAVRCLPVSHFMLLAHARPLQMFHFFCKCLQMIWTEYVQSFRIIIFLSRYISVDSYKRGSAVVNDHVNVRNVLNMVINSHDFICNNLNLVPINNTLCHAQTYVYRDRERVLFIGTRLSNLYTSVDTPARGRVVR